MPVGQSADADAMVGHDYQTTRPGGYVDRVDNGSDAIEKPTAGRGVQAYDHHPGVAPRLKCSHVGEVQVLSNEEPLLGPSGVPHNGVQSSSQPLPNDGVDVMPDIGK